MEQIFISGAAGFIGSSVTDALLEAGYRVTGFDNLSTGRLEFLVNALKSPRFRFVTGDVLDAGSLASSMLGCHMVLHFSANADVRFGLEHPSKDFEQNTRATFLILEAMRANGIHHIAFSSTGSVYGEASQIPTPEDHPFPVQTSLYGASKLAGEGMIQAYCEGFGMTATIFRFVSILGPRYTHGHVIDFCEQLRRHPGYLDVLGDGSQRKSYLHVDDCVRAIVNAVQVMAAAQSQSRLRLFNLGTEECCTVRDSIGWICAKLGLSPELRFSGGHRGWVGDNPFIFLQTSKIRETGWSPKFTIREGVEATVDWLSANPWVFDQIAVPTSA